MPETSDAQLLAAFAAGEEEALAELYRRHARPVLTVLLGLLGERADAEDELQETFVAFARQVPRLPAETNVRAYLVSAARHRAFNRRRGHGRRDAFAGRYEILVQRRNRTEPHGLERATHDNELRRLNAALADLPEAEREVVLLHTQAELGFREIAEVLGIPQGTAATRYRTALGRLRERLEA